MKLSLIALAAAAVALVSTPAHAQPGIITTQLDSAVVLMGGNGFVPVDDAVTGSLGQGEDEEFELELEAGNQYFVVGVCDGDCSDLDLVLTRGSDEIEADRELDDVPMLAIENQSGTFVLSVQMATCSSAQCHYGVRVFRSR
ncbi:MAG TPA: hypothetical protein VFY65_02505 [Longimicrobium sp.]|nr:hypothetical protein [Longimicrobium sp.]